MSISTDFAYRMESIVCSSAGCDEKFETEEDFLEHLKETHNDHDFKCHGCHASFGYIYRLRRHLKTCKTALERTTSISIVQLQVISDEISLSVENDIENVSSCSADFETQNMSERMNNTSLDETSVVVLEELNPTVILSNSGENPTDGLFEITLKLLGKMSITKNVAFGMLNDITSKVLSPVLGQIKINDPCAFENLELQINKFIDIYGTEYKFRNALKKKLMYFSAEKFDILRRNRFGSSPKSYGYIFPIEENIKAFFEVHSVALKEMIDLSSQTIENSNIYTVRDSIIWKEKIESYGESYVLPICIYQDDVEINNPLGSKRGVEKISAVYLSFPLLGKFDKDFNHLRLYHLMKL